MGVSRRSFLVICGGALLGTFALPESKEESETQKAGAEKNSDATNLESHPRIRHMLTPPSWSTKHTTMVWTESSKDKGVRVMAWSPKTPEEWEEAESFYAAATHRTWHTFDELRSQTPQPGPYVVRWIFQPHVRAYLNQTDESVLFSDDEDKSIFTGNPNEAGKFEHSKAIDVVLRFMDRLEWEEGSVCYYDTVPLAHALEAYRLLRELEEKQLLLWPLS